MRTMQRITSLVPRRASSALYGIARAQRSYSTIEAPTTTEGSATDTPPLQASTPSTPTASTPTTTATKQKHSYIAAKGKFGTTPPLQKRANASTLATSAPTLPVYNATTIADGTAVEEEPNRHVLDIDWTKSFHGVATKPVTREQFAVLMKPLVETDIEVKPDGVVYLPEIKYRRILNEAFGPMGWGLIPRGDPVVGTNIVTREYALVVDGRFVSQVQGESSYFNAEGLPSAVEGCKSNALMRCCKDLGIASELWDPIFIRSFKKKSMESAWFEHATTKKKRLMWFRKGSVDVPPGYRRS